MLLNIPNFSITKGVVTDYMHGVLLGVVKHCCFCGLKLQNIEYITKSIKNTQLITMHMRFEKSLFFNS